MVWASFALLLVSTVPYLIMYVGNPVNLEVYLSAKSHTYRRKYTYRG